jgi:putative peptidoglycan lipid II flippase
MSAHPRSLLKKGASLSALTLVSRLLGLVREMTKAALLGTSALSDAFSVAFLIPNLFRRLFAEGSIAAAFIPTFKGFLLDDDKQQTREFLSCFFTFLSFFVSLAVAVGIAAAPFIVPVFGVEAFDETVFLTRLMFPFLEFFSIAAFFLGFLNSVHVFVPSGLAPILLNIVTIACAYLLSPHTANPARAMALGIFLGGLLEAAVQIPFVLKKGFRFCFTGLRRAVKNPGTRATLRLVGPTIIGMAAYQINDLVSTALAGNAGEGIVSSLQYSLRLQELFLGVFAVSIGTVLLPDLSEYAKSSRWTEFNRRLTEACEIIALITIPVTFFAFSQGDSLIRLLFQTRSFDEDSVALTLAAFRPHICGLFFIALNRILAPAFYAQSDTASPTISGIASFAVNIVLAALLCGPLKGAGIAIALSIAGAVNSGLLVYFLKRKAGVAVGALLACVFRYILKITVFSALAVVPAVFAAPVLRALFQGHSRLISTGLPFFLSALIFALTGIGLLVISGDRYLKKIWLKNVP